VQLSAAAVRDAAEIERAVNTFASEPNGGLIVLASPVTVVNRELIALASCVPNPDNQSSGRSRAKPHGWRHRGLSPIPRGPDVGP